MKKAALFPALLLAFLWQTPVLFLSTAAVLFLGPSPAWAVNPDEIMADPVLEGRAREISKVLRCLVCQNQSIDDSDAGLAKDLRLLVRERLSKGDADAEVIEFVVSRYGDFVLLKPPFKATTLLLWLGPLLILGLGLVAVFAFFRPRAMTKAMIGASARTGAGGSDAGAEETAPRTPPPLSEDEKRRIEALMKDGET